MKFLLKIIRKELVVILFALISLNIILLVTFKNYKDYKNNLYKSLQQGMPAIFIEKIDKNITLSDISHIISYTYFLKTYQKIYIQRDENLYNSYFKGFVTIYGIDTNKYPLAFDLRYVLGLEDKLLNFRPTSIELFEMLKKDGIIINETLQESFSGNIPQNILYYLIDHKRFKVLAIFKDNSNFPLILMSKENFLSLFKNYTLNIAVNIDKVENIDYIFNKLKSKYPNLIIRKVIDSSPKKSEIVAKFDIFFKSVILFIKIVVFFLIFLSIYYFILRHIRDIKVLHYVGFDVIKGLGFIVLIIYSIDFIFDYFIFRESLILIKLLIINVIFFVFNFFYLKGLIYERI